MPSQCNPTGIGGGTNVGPAYVIMFLAEFFGAWGDASLPSIHDLSLVAAQELGVRCVF
jgi:hypothetical protein